MKKHGVCLYVSNNLRFVPVDVSIPNVAAVFLLDYDVSVVVVYRSPSYLAEENAELVEFLLEFCVGREVVVLGDFNLPTLDWSGDVFNHYIPPVASQFLDCFALLGLTQ